MSPAAALLAALLLPRPAAAQCTAASVCGGGYGSRTLSFPDAASCEAARADALKSLSASGGGCRVGPCSCAQAAPAPKPRPKDAAPRREAGRRTETEEEKRRRQAEFLRERDAAIADLKGPASGPRTGWRAALDCALAPVLRAAEARGAEGRRFAEELSAELAAPAKPKAGADDEVASLDLQRQFAQGGKEGQFAVSAVVVRRADGSVRVTAAGHASGGPGGAFESQSVVHLDAAGAVTALEAPAEVEHCVRPGATMTR